MLVSDAPLVPGPALTTLVLSRRQQVNNDGLDRSTLVNKIESQADRRRRVAAQSMPEERLDDVHQIRDGAHCAIT